MTDENFPNQPDEQGALKAVITDFMGRWKALDHEIELLKTDKKDLIEEFSSQLDVKTLKAAIRVWEIETAVKHRDTYDRMSEALRDGVDGI
jgi:uncharacterized protein (UPF0335 family)